ncbi:MAG: hypothetical protein SGCHY_005366, partial [Lobulomycetales sp.]
LNIQQLLQDLWDKLKEELQLLKQELHLLKQELPLLQEGLQLLKQELHRNLQAMLTAIRLQVVKQALSKAPRGVSAKNLQAVVAVAESVDGNDAPTVAKAIQSSNSPIAYELKAGANIANPAWLQDMISWFRNLNPQEKAEVKQESKKAPANAPHKSKTQAKKEIASVVKAAVSKGQIVETPAVKKLENKLSGYTSSTTTTTTSTSSRTSTGRPTAQSARNRLKVGFNKGGNAGSLARQISRLPLYSQINTMKGDEKLIASLKALQVQVQAQLQQAPAVQPTY